MTRKRGAASNTWKGGRVRYGGYMALHRPDHPRAKPSTGYVYEHIVIVESALGRFLPDGAQVHHVDGDPYNNAPGNLVVCQDHAYHAILHKRARAYAACGNADAHRCVHCASYDRQEDMTVLRVGKPNRAKEGTRAYHRDCAAADMRVRKAAWKSSVAGSKH